MSEGPPAGGPSSFCRSAGAVGEREAVTITRLVVLVVGIAALAAAVPSLRGNATSLQKQVSRWGDAHGGNGQSAEQLWRGEFASGPAQMAPPAPRTLGGSPADESTVKV